MDLDRTMSLLGNMFVSRIRAENGKLALSCVASDMMEGKRRVASE